MEDGVVKQGHYLYSERPFAEAVKARRQEAKTSGKVTTNQFQSFAQYQFCKTGFRHRQYDDQLNPPRRAE